jgi:tetratricopeptide (TPR) repeat protein
MRYYRESIAAAERLVELDPENVDFEERLGEAVNNLGYKLLQNGNLDEALPCFLRAIEIHRRIVAKVPEVPKYRGALINPLLNLASVRIAQGKSSEAIAAALEARSQSETFPDYLGEVAAMLSGGAGLIAEGRAERQQYLNLAMEVLRQGLSSGAATISEVRDDPGFAPLRSRTDFQALIYDPVFPADPFTPGD